MQAFRRILFPISWIWGIVAWIRHAFYDVGIFKIERVKIPVISIGNIAVGGTGKTPLTILLGNVFSNKKVAILARGYGGGDEMKVIRRHLPRALLYEGADRVKSARRAVKEGAELILLDDGFQHRRLHRDLDVVIVRERDFSDRYLPAGDLRDSPKRLKKAMVVDFYETEASCDVDLRGERVAIFCGIANPERFLKTVEGLGATVVKTLFLNDHEPIGEKRLRKFYDKSNAKYLLCTEKDAVKLPFTELPVQVVKLGIKRESVEWLIEKIEEIVYN